jgi:hypothetical protein
MFKYACAVSADEEYDEWSSLSLISSTVDSFLCEILIRLFLIVYAIWGLVLVSWDSLVFIEHALVCLIAFRREKRKTKRARFIEYGFVFFEAFFVVCSNMLVWFPPMRNTTNGCKNLHPFR